MGARAAGKFDEVLSGAGRGVVWSLDWRHWGGRWRGTMLLVLLPQEQLCSGGTLGTVADRATVQLWKLQHPC